MRAAIISDIHGNLEALEAVLRDLEKRHIDDIWFLGDAINYCTDSAKVVSLLCQNVNLNNWIAGNHEELYWGESEDSFDYTAIVAMEFTRNQLLNSESGDFLMKNQEELRKTKNKKMKGYEIVLSHQPACIEQKYGDGYVFPFDEEKIKEVLAQKKHYIESKNQPKRWYLITPNSEQTCIYLHGHTHVPVFAVYDSKSDTMHSNKLNGEKMLLRRKGFYPTSIFINPGSVGYPRDNIPSASYAILDLKKGFCEYVKVDYQFNEEKFRKLIASFKNQQKKQNTINLLQHKIKTACLARAEVMPSCWYDYYMNQGKNHRGD